MGDSREAAAQAAAAKAYAKAQRPWWRKKRWWVLAVVVVVVIAAAASSGGGKKNSASRHSGVSTLSGNETHPPQDDVAVTGCTAGVAGTVTATVTVTNHSSQRSDYLIGVTFQDGAGVQIGDTSRTADNVDAGQTARIDAGAFVSGDATGVKCVIKSVQRTASLG